MTAEQARAVGRTGQDVCVVAGPGSGKTRVLVERFAWLVGQGTPPARILAITFTEKAAYEIRARLRTRFADREELRRELDRAPVSTIHGFCFRLLKEHAIAARLDPEFQVFDETDAYAEQIAALEATLDRFASERREESRALFDAWRVTRIVPDLLDVYESIRTGALGIARSLETRRQPEPAEMVGELRRTVESMLNRMPPVSKPKQILKIEGLREWLRARPEGLAALDWLAAFDADKTTFRSGPIYESLDRIKDELIPGSAEALATSYFHREWATLGDIVRGFDAAYRARKRALARLDFADLEEFALRLLQTDAGVRRDVREQFDAILMDELQDTNPVQWAILQEVRPPGGLFAVGDINQSIYAFRYADPALFAAYQRELESGGRAVDRLERNFRSRVEILESVSAVTGRLPGIQPHQLIAGREFPAKTEPSVEILRAETPETEALWVARRIGELRDCLLVDDAGVTRPATFGDFAVLARNAAVFEALEGALRRAGIPYVIQRGRNFFEEQEALDLTNWLRVLAREDDEIALYGLLRSPFFGYSDEELFEIRQSGAAGPAEALEKIAALKRLLPDEAVDLMLSRLLDECGYVRGREAQGRANTRKFLAMVRRWQAEYPGDLEKWLQAIANLRLLGRETGAPLADEAGAVRITTVHAAKGLEFPVVFLMGLQKGSDSFSGSVNWSAEGGLGANWRHPEREESLPDAAHRWNRRRTAEIDEREASRLLYVAMTRAEEHLVLTYQGGSSRRGKWVEAVETGLAVNWEIPANVAAVRNGVRLWRAVGRPEDTGTVTREAGLERRAVEIEPLQEGAQPEASLPVSALVDYAQCPFRYFLSQKAGWPKPDPGPAAQIGTLVHQALAGRPVPDMPEIGALARRFEQSPLAQRARRAVEREQEAAFLFSVHGTALRGTIDLWFVEDGEAVLVDYKTDRAPSPLKLAAYERQLQIYALSIQARTGRRVKQASLFFLRSGEAVDVRVDEAALEEAEGLVAEARGATQFALRVGEQCRTCPYYQGPCPARLTPELEGPA